MVTCICLRIVQFIWSHKLATCMQIVICVLDQLAKTIVYVLDLHDYFSCSPIIIYII